MLNYKTYSLKHEIDFIPQHVFSTHAHNLYNEILGLLRLHNNLQE